MNDPLPAGMATDGKDHLGAVQVIRNQTELPLQVTQRIPGSWLTTPDHQYSKSS